MNARRALQLSKQAGRMGDEILKALPPHPAAKGDSDMRDWSSPLGRGCNALFTARDKLLNAAKDMAITEMEAKP